MSDIQLQLDVEVAARNWAATMMQQYNISAFMLDNALTKIQLELKNLILQEALQQLSASTEEVEGEKQDDDNQQDSI